MKPSAHRSRRQPDAKKNRVHKNLAPKGAVPSQPVSVTLTRAVDLFQSKDVAAALELLQSLRERDLDSAQSVLAGLIYLGAELDRDALSWFDRALRDKQPSANLFAHRALALRRLGQKQEAIESYDKALARGGLDANGYYLRGNLLRELGRLDEAIASYDAALRINPAYPEALYAGGTVLQDSGRYEAAIQFFDEALRIKPDFCQAWFSRGNALQRLKRIDDALSSYGEALRLSPGHPDILTNRGIVLYDAGRSAEALACYDEALLARPQFPQALLNRANVWLRLNEPLQALNDCDAALTLNPAYIEALSSRGIALRDLGRIVESIAAFDAALAINPGFAHARNNRGAALLLMGDFEKGWEDYEYRWIGGETPKRELKLALPDWTGEVKAGKTRQGEHILVFDEQGFGDALQFSRYLPLLVQAGAKVTFFCRKRLHRLFRYLDGAINIVDTIGPIEEFDSQAALSSLPFLFKTRLETIPAQVPYLSAEPERVTHWEHRIGKHGFKTGLCWQGNKDIRADPRRSIPLSAFAPLAQVETVRLISLQAGAGTEQLEYPQPGLLIESLGDEFDAGPDAFLDAAAVMQRLDLIITCDTSIAHLAGALARPVWLLLKPVPDWRWLLKGTGTPWYPSMRLFRRSADEDWDGLIQRVASALSELILIR